jgi:hypothetical protein
MRLPLLSVPLACLALAAPAAAVTHVTVRVEGADHTLVDATRVALPAAAVVKDGDPAHACAPTSAAGALEAATKGDWRGTWGASPLGYSVDAIGGEEGSFALWVDNRLEGNGLCQARLRSGASVLLFPQPPGATYRPLAVRAPRSARRRHAFTVSVVDYTTRGKARPAARATVYANGGRVGATDAKGRIEVRGTKTGTVEFYAAKKDRVRSGTAVTRIRKR